MGELIAKRYITALRNSVSAEDFEVFATIFSALAAEFKNEKFVQIVTSPNVSKEQKSGLLLGIVASAQSNELNNLLSLLVENGRVSIIPTMAEAMRKQIACSSNSYSGKVYSDSELDSKTIDSLAYGLHQKMDAVISLDFVKSDYNGIKVEVEDLGVEINFSKDRLDAQLIDHILKAI